jgi:hypothetical protein
MASSSILTAYAFTKQSITTSSDISVIPRAPSRSARPKSTGCYGGGLSAIRNVVSLAEGLETQVRRVDNGRVRWLSVDLPDAIRLRERFLAASDRFRHIGVSVLDPAWMDAVDPSAGVFIVAQGLLMYLEPEMVRQLFCGIAARFPGMEMAFDVVPNWFSSLTLLGLNQTSHYRLPPMPWGINRDELEPVLRQWCPYIAGVTFLDYCAPRGLPLLLARMCHHVPFFRHEVPSLVHVATTKADRPRP